MSSIECSRALLLAGPQPPLSHFGATLLRHVVTTGLRFALHSLGAPIPESPPVRIVRLRLYLDRSKLEEVLGDSPGGAELLGALLEPGGTGELPTSLRGAAAFHRARLRLSKHGTPERSRESGWPGVRTSLTRWLPRLQDAILVELLAALKRRSLREGGKRVRPATGAEARAFVDDGTPDLDALGGPDPFVTAWSAAPSSAERARDRRDALEEATPHAGRGTFRETYRRALNDVRAAYLPIAERACERGLLDSPGDAFFLPFDLGEDLDGTREPDWLARAVTTNRAEYQSLAESESPPQTIRSGAAEERVDDRSDWLLAPLWPLA